jgi:hypothetical protein
MDPVECVLDDRITRLLESYGTLFPKDEVPRGGQRVIARLLNG